jgi:anti-anti-sigma factor
MEAGDPRDGRLEIAMRGELDLEDSARVDAVLTDLQSAAHDVTLDLRELTFIDSSGARSLWSAHVRAREAGGSLTVIVAPGAVRRALAVTGLDGELSVVEDGLPGGGAA